MHAKQVLSILSLLFAAIAPAFAQSDPNQKSTPAELVDALNGVFGKQTDNRAVHAKGIVLEGKFYAERRGRCAEQGAASPVGNNRADHRSLLGLCRRAGDP